MCTAMPGRIPHKTRNVATFLSPDTQGNSNRTWTPSEPGEHPRLLVCSTHLPKNFKIAHRDRVTTKNKDEEEKWEAKGLESSRLEMGKSWQQFKSLPAPGPVSFCPFFRGPTGFLLSHQGHPKLPTLLNTVANSVFISSSNKHTQS